MSAPHQNPHFYAPGSSNLPGDGIPSPNPPIDPNLAVYQNNPFYRPYPPQVSHSPEAGMSSSDAGSHPNSPAVIFNHNVTASESGEGAPGKRGIAQTQSAGIAAPDRKRPRKDEDDDDDEAALAGSGQVEAKPKSTRGSRYSYVLPSLCCTTS